jgi:O-antigen ligase
MVKHKTKKDRGVLSTLGLLLTIPLLILLIGVIRRFFDASMQERVGRYLSSREGSTLVQVYVLLIITAIVITFPRQLTKALRFVLKKASALKGAAGGLARATSERRGLKKLRQSFIKAVALLKARQTPSLRGFFRRIRHNKHRRKTA